MEKIINDVIREVTNRQARNGLEDKPGMVWGMEIAEKFGNMSKAINEFYCKPSDEMEENIYNETIQTIVSCMLMLDNIERINSIE